MQRYRIRAVIFDIMDQCKNLKRQLSNAGIPYVDVVFGMQKEQQKLLEAADTFGLPAEDILFLTNQKKHAAIAVQLQMPCIGCVEGTYELPETSVLISEPGEVSLNYLEIAYCHEKHYPAVILTTERCFLRELAEEDIGQFQFIDGGEKIQEKNITGPFRNGGNQEEEEKIRSYIRNVYPFFEYAYWGIFEKKSEKLIGWAGFREGSLPPEAGYMLHHDYRGKGIAKEVLSELLYFASEELGAGEVTAWIHQTNAASCRVAEKCGMSLRKITEIGKEDLLLYEIKL